MSRRTCLSHSKNISSRVYDGRDWVEGVDVGQALVPIESRLISNGISSLDGPHLSFRTRSISHLNGAAHQR